MERLEKLNAIHADWMALDSLAPEKQKQKIFKSMEQYPKIYISLNADKTEGIVMHHGTPCQAKPIPVSQAIKHVGIDKAVAWHGLTGTWVNL